MGSLFNLRDLPEIGGNCGSSCCDSSPCGISDVMIDISCTTALRERPWITFGRLDRTNVTDLLAELVAEYGESVPDFADAGSDSDDAIDVTVRRVPSSSPVPAVPRVRSEITLGSGRNRFTQGVQAAPIPHVVSKLPRMRSARQEARKAPTDSQGESFIGLSFLSQTMPSTANKPRGGALENNQHSEVPTKPNWAPPGQAKVSLTPVHSCAPDHPRPSRRQRSSPVEIRSSSSEIKRPAKAERSITRPPNHQQQQPRYHYVVDPQREVDDSDPGQLWNIGPAWDAIRETFAAGRAVRIAPQKRPQAMRRSFSTSQV